MATSTYSTRLHQFCYLTCLSLLFSCLVLFMYPRRWTSMLYNQSTYKDYRKIKSNLIKNFRPCVCGHDKGNMMGSWAEQMNSFPSRVSILSVKKWSINLITVQGWNSLFRIKIISFCPMSNPSSSAFVNLWNFSLGAVWCCADDGVKVS